MDLSKYVKEFKALQKTQKVRVADFCRDRMLDYYEMVEALKKDKFLSEVPQEQVGMKVAKNLAFAYSIPIAASCAASPHMITGKICSQMVF